MRKKGKSRTLTTVRKRKKFAEIFVQRCVIVFLVMLIIYIVGLTFFVTYKKNQIRSTYYECQSSQISNMFAVKVNRDEDLFSNYMQLQLAMLADTRGFFGMLCDADTGEIIAGCEEKLFFIKCESSEEEAVVCICSLEDIPGWREYRSRLPKPKGYFGRIYENIDEFQYIYTDGIRLVPDTVKIDVVSVDYGMLGLGPMKEKVLQKVELNAPENIPTEFEMLDVSNYLLANPVIIGYSEDSPYMNYKYCSDDSYVLLQDYFKNDWVRKQHVTKTRMIESFFTIEMVSEVEVELSEEKKVSLLGACYYDVREFYGAWMIAMAVLLSGMALLFSWLLARATYSRMKAQYDMEDYRKNLMNTMAHDLRSPLMSISGYAENLRENIYEDKRMYYTEAILNNVQYMNHIIKSVLDLSKIESGSIVLQRENIDMKKLLSDSMEKYVSQLQERNLRLIQSGELVLQGDKVLMEQMMDNLLGNAVKYATVGSPVEVIMTKQSILVCNHCEEKLNDIIDTLCEPFVMGELSRSNKSGSGLGLAIVKNICGLHGFRLEIRFDEGIFEVRIEV